MTGDSRVHQQQSTTIGAKFPHSTVHYAPSTLNSVWILMTPVVGSPTRPHRQKPTDYASETKARVPTSPVAWHTHQHTSPITFLILPAPLTTRFSWGTLFHGTFCFVRLSAVALWASTITRGCFGGVASRRYGLVAVAGGLWSAQSWDLQYPRTFRADPSLKHYAMFWVADTTETSNYIPS